MKNSLLYSPTPRSYDVALLVLRVTFGLSLFAKHGWEKLANFSGMAATFPDPIGIGPTASLLCALVGDAFCAVFILVGFCSRIFSGVAVLNLLVAFAFVHHFAWFGPHNGEVAYLYLCALLAILIAGPGRFSLDHWLAERRAGHSPWRHFQSRPSYA